MTSNLNAFSSRGAAMARGFLTAVAIAACADRAVAQTTPPPAAQKPDASPSAGTTTGTVEIGAGHVSEGSFKAGEFNGLQKKGAFGIAGVDFRGGGAYDSDSAFRWRVKGTDLGLDTRNLTAEAGVQGRFRVTFGYDSLLRNRSDSYQTPYNGTGTNTLTLPGTWQVPLVPSSAAANNRATSTSARGFVGAIAAAPYIDTQTGSPTIGTLLTPNAAQLALVNGAAAADVPLFHDVNLSTKRTRFDAGLSANLTPEWVVDLGVRAEHKDGLKPMGTVSRNTGADVATIIPDLIDTDTSQVSSSVSYKRDRGFLQAGYYGSFFTNHVPSMNWQNWATGPTGTGTMNQMSSTPDNTFHQLNMEGRYNLSSITRLVANGSYARNTQNDTFLTDASTPIVPVSSLNGLVVSTAFGATLTSRLHKASLVAGYRFADRDDRTGVHIFQFADAGEAPAVSANFPAGAGNLLGAVIAQNANANRPYSSRKNLANLEADYQVAKGQWIKGGYDFERIDRSCPGSWISCADAGVTNENRLRAEWRANIGQTLNARVDYTYAARRAPSYNDNAFLALVPYANVSPAAATGGATAYSFMVANGFNPWGPPLGFSVTTGNMNVFFPSNNALANAAYANNNRISEILGLRRYYVSDRNRGKLRSALDWQATDAVSLGSGVDVTGDDYLDAKYGLQSSRGVGVNVDGTYAVGDGVSASAFYSFERQRGITDGNTYTANSNTANVNGFTGLSGNTCDTFTTLQERNNNNKLDPCLDWSANMRDRIHTFGFTLAKKTDTLAVSSDAIYARARSTNDVSGGSWANNPLALAGAPAGTIAAYFIAATPLPIVTTNTLEWRLNGTYTVAAHQSVRLVYAYMRMRSVDWVYDGMQIGAGTLNTVLPTNETPFNYGVHVIGVSYVIAF
jgi:MtrB/PioB family decaheme-associated outer membrane protein